MKRANFLAALGLTFLGAVFSSSKKAAILTDCGDPITPPVPEGPYYKDEKLNRPNIAEHKEGLPITYLFKVEDSNCKPIAGAIVDIWQCDNNGHYSDYQQEKTLGETWLRGYQVTDKQGKVKFDAIFPGWYNGRLTHLHAKVRIDGKAPLTTNFFFPKEVEDKVYQHPLYPKGPNPVTLAQDFELRGDKDTHRRDTLLIQVSHDEKGNMVAKYTIAIA
jgi:protocatechuate 3,4-dioxygenase beta subunit